MATCPQCHANIPAGSANCPQCGAVIGAPQAPAAPPPPGGGPPTLSYSIVFQSTSKSSVKSRAGPKSPFYGTLCPLY